MSKGLRSYKFLSLSKIHLLQKYFITEKKADSFVWKEIQIKSKV